MKRCPKCNFIHLDTDELCDLDQTKLVSIEEAEIEAAARESSSSAVDQNVLTQGTPTSSLQQPSRSGKPGTLVALAIGGITIALILLVVFFALGRRNREAPLEQNSNQAATALIQPEVTPSPSPIESASPLPEVSPSPSPRVSPSPRTTAARGTVSSDPVSTDSQAAKAGSVTIRLTNGARIEADEVWRTKDGVWYRRNGVVTLLKRNQVRAIERAQ